MQKICLCVRFCMLLSHNEHTCFVSEKRLIMAHISKKQGVRRFPVSRILLCVKALSEIGIPAAQTLDGTGLDENALESSEVRTSAEQFLHVLKNVAAIDPRPEIGLRIGLSTRASTYGMYGYAMLCAPTLRAALDTGIRFQQLTGGMDNQSWYVAGDDAVILPAGNSGLEDQGFSPREARVISDFQTGGTVSVVRDVMGNWCRPSVVAFNGAATDHAQALARLLGCPLVFDAPRNEVHYPTAMLERAPQFANPITAEEVSETCSRLLDEMLWDAGTTRRVYHELTNRPGQFPDIETVASALCMTSRTLRRKLEAEGTSFRQLLDKIRYALASDYLRSPKMPVDDIAYALGFSDTPSFRRAFKRWSGKNPSELRP